MLNLKLCCLYAATLIFSLPHKAEINLFSAASQLDLNKNKTIIVKNKDDRVPWMLLGLPLGFVALGGVTYVFFSSRHKNSQISYSKLNLKEDSNTSVSERTNTLQSNTNSPLSSDRENDDSHFNSPWRKLKQIKEYWQRMQSLCVQLEQIIQIFLEQGVIPLTLAEEIKEIIKKLESNKFRIAIIGEFNTGKSTLINALLGEEIQLYASHVRAIAPTDSAPRAIAVLKYGEQKRIICRYQDGTEKEITLNNNRREWLENSQIEEIIIEHPDLDLCRNGVEIVDSPGLNEHPNQTSMLVKLLKNTDAAIFLTSALQILTQEERRLLLKIRALLNGNHQNDPAQNLFVVVNFIERLRTATGKQEIEEVVYQFLREDTRIIAQEDRIHFVSAKFSLDAILSGKNNNYIESFYQFTSALESSLVDQRNAIKFQLQKVEINRMIDDCLGRIDRVHSELEEKVKKSEENIQKIFKQMRKANECDRRIMNLANNLKQEAFDEASQSWNTWINGLQERLSKGLDKWSSEHNPVLEQKEVIKDYVNQFLQDIEKEIDNWGEAEIQTRILKPKLEYLEENIRQELSKIKNEFSYLEGGANNNYAQEIDLNMNKIEGSWGSFLNYLFGGMVGGGLGAGLLLFLELLTGPLGLVIAGGVVTALAGAFGFGIGRIKEQIKLKVFEAGWKNFVEASEELGEKVGKTIIAVFDNRVESATKVVQGTIVLWENLLEQQEQVYQEVVKQYEASKSWSEPKRQELEQIKNQLEEVIERVSAL